MAGESFIMTGVAVRQVEDRWVEVTIERLGQEPLVTLLRWTADLEDGDE